MSRPEFVTNEDIIRWTQNIDNDPEMPPVLIDNPIIKEVCFAGLWLSEELSKLGCPSDRITRIQFMAGRLCFGRDPWVVVQRVLDTYKNDQIKFSEDYDNSLN